MGFWRRLGQQFRQVDEPYGLVSLDPPPPVPVDVPMRPLSDADG